MFAYCGNNPVNMMDSNGREAIALSLIGLFCVVAMVVVGIIGIIQSPEFQKAWSNLCLGVTNTTNNGLNTISGAINNSLDWISSKAKSIIQSIADSFARVTTQPNYKSEYELHHLVAKKAPNAKYAAAILRDVFEDGTENYENLMIIKTGLHRRLHTNAYYGWANSIVISAYNSALGNKTLQKSNVKKALRTIRVVVAMMDAIAPF